MKKINEDWQGAFPELVKYAQYKYYKILDSVLVGIELVKLPRAEGYRPYFVIYSLFGNRSGKDLKACLSSPLVLKEFFDNKGRQLSISDLKHTSEFSIILDYVKKQLPFDMEGNVSLKRVFLALDEYSSSPPLSASPNSYLQASLLESKLEIAICSGSEKQVQDIFRQISKKDWDLEHFAMWDVNYIEWIKGLENKIANKKELLEILNTNRGDRKLKMMYQSEVN
ncbi:hypothetical protein V6246_09400 [Algibacter sp. TI.3.09]|uniref:hypothetical protein n=1 Tax=Algibacter sp. TI.3.09 TaxID=3121298 RepID=UPI00311D879C